MKLTKNLIIYFFSCFGSCFSQASFIQKHINEGKSYSRARYELFLARKWQSKCLGKKLSDMLKCRVYLEVSSEKTSIEALNHKIFQSIDGHSSIKELEEVQRISYPLLSKYESQSLDQRLKELKYMKQNRPGIDFE